MVIWALLALAHARIRVEFDLCTSRQSSTKLLPQGQGKQNSLWMRIGFEGRYERIPNVYSYKDFASKPKPFYLKGSLLKSSQLEVQYRSRDILCLERIQLTDEINNYSIDLLEDWARSTAFAQRNGWSTLTKRKTTFMTDSCSPDGREFSKLPEFKKACTSHIFVQYDPHKSNACYARRRDLTSKCGWGNLCLETPSGGRCSCSQGYVMKKGRCVDIDECENHSHGCIGFAQCTNTPGSYTCSCDDGVQGPRCDQDINECEADKKLCKGKNQLCINTYGSYFCECSRGYKMSPDGKCVDINECEKAEMNTCWSTLHCKNVPGTYKCYCPEGFVGDGRSCEDVDECATGQHNCHELGSCRNKVGSFECTCDTGTLGNGTYCESFPPDDHRLPVNLGRSLAENSDIGVQCGLNEKYRPWVVPKDSCPEPSCQAKLDIINAWHTTTSRRNKRAAKLYGDTKDWWGWSGTITVPQEFINDFAVILRFPREIYSTNEHDKMRGSFETWNLQMKSFALSDGGYDLLLTPKDQPDSTLGSDKYELLHPNQFQIVAQRLKSPYFPSIVFWNTTNIDPSCFGQQTAANMDLMKQRVRRDDKVERLDDVRKLVLVNDEIRALRRL